MSFIAQDFNFLNVITILDGRTQATIRNHFLRYPRKVRNRVKVITMDMFSPYYQLAKQLFPNAKNVLDRFHIVQHLSRAMNRVRIQIMNQFNRKSHEYRALKRYWKLIQQDSRKLSDKRFYRPMFRMHLTNKEISKNSCLSPRNYDNTMNSISFSYFISKRRTQTISLTSSNRK